MIFSSRSARERLIKIFKSKYSKIPQEADVALVLGTSLSLYPDKFKKRVYTAVQLAKKGRVSRVIFSGKGDHETNDTNQALDAKKLAVFEFGLDEEKILTVGGNNTKENIEMARGLLTGYKEEIRGVYVVSSSEHLVRAMPLVDSIFREIGVHAHPFPILNEGEVNPDDPKVILEIIKAVLYNRIFKKTPNPVDVRVRECIDKIALLYTQKTKAMLGVDEIPFEEWERRIVEGKQKGE